MAGMLHVERPPPNSGFSVDAIGDTPMRSITIQIGHRGSSLYLKLEGYNPGGSIKDRTALALVRDLESRGLVRKNSTIVEFTSGNLGVGLSCISKCLGYRFIAVVDPKLTAENADKMRCSGAILELVTRQDVTGGYLLTRLERVKELLSFIPGAAWPNQYDNHANVRAHLEGTGPEILRQMSGRIDAIFVGVSTGGTLAGISRSVRGALPGTRVIAVDAQGSIAFGGAPSPRLLTGIGASRRITLAQRADYSTVMYVTDVDAFACCRALAHCAGVHVGGSSGATIAAAVRWLTEASTAERTVCVCADTGFNYQSSIFDDDYVATTLPEVQRRQRYYEAVFAESATHARRRVSHSGR